MLRHVLALFVERSASVRISPEHADLDVMTQVPANETMHILGAPVSTTADLELEFAEIIAKGLQTLHSKAPFWRSGGSKGARLKVLHLSASVDACFSWASGTRHWTAGELQQVRSLQLKMSRRIAKRYPQPRAKNRPASQRRCLSLEWRQTGIPPWARAISLSWRRWAGHSARQADRCPERRRSKSLGWKDAWWRHTIRGSHAGHRGTSNRLGRGHRLLGRRRWGDLIQQVVNTRGELPWQAMAHDREVWAELETEFVARAMRVSARTQQPSLPGNHMMPDARMPPADCTAYT